MVFPPLVDESAPRTPALAWRGVYEGTVVDRVTGHGPDESRRKKFIRRTLERMLDALPNAHIDFQPAAGGLASGAELVVNDGAIRVSYVYSPSTSVAIGPHDTEGFASLAIAIHAGAPTSVAYWAVLGALQQYGARPLQDSTSNL